MSSISGFGSLSRALLPISDTSFSLDDSTAPAAATFQKMLLKAFQETNATDDESQRAIAQFQLEGEITKPEVFIAIRKAELALKMTMQIRNKILEAYKEIQQMRM